MNTVVERIKENPVAFATVTFVSILSRRMKRLIPQEFSA
jgi:hypothetical protein